MSPYDIDLETLLRLLAEEKTSHSGGFNAAFCDGAVRFLPTKISPETLKALLTIDGEEIMPPDAFE